MAGKTRRKKVEDLIALLTFPIDRYISWVAMRAVHERPYVFGDRRRLSVARNTFLNNALLNVVSGSITIEEFVFLGHNVSLITGSHDMDRFGLPRMKDVSGEGRDIVIETGAWIASNALVVGPCRIGAHAVVAAGSVVTCDVAPGEVVGGVPARRIKLLDLPGSSAD